MLGKKKGRSDYRADFSVVSFCGMAQQDDNAWLPLPAA